MLRIGLFLSTLTGGRVSKILTLRFDGRIRLPFMARALASYASLMYLCWKNPRSTTGQYCYAVLRMSMPCV